MPYSNLPKSKWAAMERCVADVKKKGDVDNAYAVCYSSIMKESAKEFVDALLDEDDVDEMTGSGAIATMPMGMGDLGPDERTPKDPEKTKEPGAVPGMKSLGQDSDSGTE